jgi:hypothetical protein
MVRRRTPVAGPLAVEGEPTGDGRLLEHNSLTWDGVLPVPIVWDSEDGDHSGSVLGAIESITRRSNGVIWGDGYVEDSDVEEFQALVDRAREVLEQGAVGVSLRLDSEDVEVRVKRELIEVGAVQEASIDPPQLEESSDGERIVVARFAADDVLYVTTSARVRHLAIVDTAAICMVDGERFGLAASGELAIATGAIAASAMSGDWTGHEWMFQDPKFGDFTTDARLRYDPDRSIWSCPTTVTDDSHAYGHITPQGICLRGRPDKCVNPPDGDLQGFMRGRAPAAGGLRTGVICVSGGHCQTGIGVLEATQFYDNTGHAVADVRVGLDRYGVWFSGMIRPGATKEQIYAFEASDVSGHWEYPVNGTRSRATLVGLPAVNVGGFPKGWMTYQEYTGGLAASASVVGEGCGTWHDAELVSDDVGERLRRMEFALGEMYAAHLRSQEVQE